MTRIVTPSRTRSGGDGVPVPPRIATALDGLGGSEQILPRTKTQVNALGGSVCVRACVCA